MNLKDDTFIHQLLSTIFSILLPAMINLAVFLWHGKQENVSDEIKHIVVVVSASLSVVYVVVYYRILPCIGFLRKYSEYEGRWLEIIPALTNRPFAIIDFKYSARLKQYVLNGVNYSKDLKTFLEFRADKFVESDYKDGFYYITNETTECKIGLGKISFLRNQPDNLKRAQGYFFDADTTDCSKKYDTYFVKYDKNFMSELGFNDKYLKIKKIPSAKLAELSEKFVEGELSRHSNSKRATP